MEWANGANHEGLATLLWADGDTVGHRTAQNMGHGISLFGGVEFQPGVLGIYGVAIYSKGAEEWWLSYTNPELTRLSKVLRTSSFLTIDCPPTSHPLFGKNRCQPNTLLHF